MLNLRPFMLSPQPVVLIPLMRWKAVPRWRVDSIKSALNGRFVQELNGLVSSDAPASHDANLVLHTTDPRHW